MAKTPTATTPMRIHVLGRRDKTAKPMMRASSARPRSCIIGT